MSDWTYDPRYTRYTDEQYYQEPVLGTTSHFGLQSSQTYSDIQCTLLDVLTRLPIASTLLMRL
jgi:hypothetical protein